LSDKSLMVMHIAVYWQ